jgi:hypothetical protein
VAGHTGSIALPPGAGTGVCAAHNSRQRYRRSVEDRSQGDQHPGLPAGGRISGRVHREGPASRGALPPGWSERILCGISQSTCWKRVWTVGRTQGHQGSQRNYVAAIALHRDSIARTLAHTSEQEQRIPIRIGEAGVGSKSSKFYNSEDSDSRCTRPQRTGEGYSLHSRHD